MTLWEWIPPYAEQVTINQVQETLSEFRQLIPDSFVELEQLNRMCSTQGWKEPTCERYNCLINGEWKQVDIRHTLLEELGLEKGGDIPFPVHISSTVLDKGLDRYLAYNIENEAEIFLEKSFTVEGLKGDINGLLEKVEEQKEKNNQLTTQLEELQDAITQWRNQFATETERLRGELREKNNEIERLNTELRKEEDWWDKWFEDENDRFDFAEYPELERIAKEILQRSSSHELKIILQANQERSGFVFLKESYYGSGNRGDKQLIKILYQYYRNR